MPFQTATDVGKDLSCPLESLANHLAVIWAASFFESLDVGSDTPSTLMARITAPGLAHSSTVGALGSVERLASPDQGCLAIVIVAAAYGTVQARALLSGSGAHCRPYFISFVFVPKYLEPRQEKPP